jgi:hypothetical protein
MGIISKIERAVGLKKKTRKRRKKVQPAALKRYWAKKRR